MIYKISDDLVLPVQSERTIGEACPKPNNESFIPNALGSPISHKVYPNDAHNLKINFAENNHPCGVGLWTWAVVMHSVDQGAKALPNPRDMELNFTGWYNCWLPAADLRAIIGAQFWWDDKAHLIEISSLNNWGDAHESPLIVESWESDTLDFVNLDAQHSTGFVKNSEVPINIKYGCLLDDLIAKGHLAAPKDWAWSTTQAWFIGLEMANHRSGGTPMDTAGVGDLWFRGVTNSSV